MFSKYIEIFNWLSNWLNNRFIFQVIKMPFVLAGKGIKLLYKLIIDIKKYYFPNLVAIGTTIINFLIWCLLFLFMIKGIIEQTNDNTIETTNSERLYAEFMESTGWLDIIGIFAVVTIISFFIAIFLSLIIMIFLRKAQHNNSFILTNKWYDIFFKMNIVIITFSFVFLYLIY